MTNTLPNLNWLYTLWARIWSFPGFITNTDCLNDLGGKRPVPGFYESNSMILIQHGDLTLDAKGDPMAVWFFKTRKSIVTIGGSGGNVVLKGGAQPENIFWETNRFIHIGRGTSFTGNLRSIKSITWISVLRAKALSIFRNGHELLHRKYSLKGSILRFSEKPS